MSKGKVMSEDMYNHIFNNINKLKSYDLKTGVITTVKGTHGVLDGGYLRIKLNKKTVLVHQVIAVISLGRDCIGKQVNHKNGNKLDNSADNLEVVTLDENIKHAIENGLFENSFKKGRPNHYRKLTDEMIEEIVRDNTHTYTELGNKYNVHEQTIYKIKKKYRCPVA